MRPAELHAGSKIKSDEEVVFFTTAANLANGAWQAPIHGWIFEFEEDSLWRSAIARGLRKALRVAKNQEAIFRRRVLWFLVDNERGKRITVRVGGIETTLAKSGADGHFQGIVQIPASRAGRAGGHSLRIRAKTRKGDDRRFEGILMLVGDEGLSVISDIDDTIKITGAYDRTLALKRTFLHRFEEVPGMARAYREWSRQGAVFHYVSASPWHLFVPLSQFMRRSVFPIGSLHLRDFRLKSSSRWNLLKSSKDYKLGNISKLLEQFPKRHFILVGDTGESDPEIYSEVARRFPGRIQAIYLRQVRRSDVDDTRRRAAQHGHDVPVRFFQRASELPLTVTP